MGNKEKRSIKEVGGFKVNHPFSGGNLLFAFFTLLLIALPVSMFFFPVVRFGPSGTYTITGFDLFKYIAIDLFKPSETLAALPYSLAGGSDAAPMFKAYVFIQLGQAFVMCLFMLIGVIAFIFFLVNICKGYLRHPRAVKGLTVLNFVAAILFGLSYLFFYIMDMVMNSGATELFIWFSFIPAGAMLITLIFMSINIRVTYQDVVYEADLEFHEDEVKEEVAHVTEVHEVTKVKYESSKTLPPNLTSIGGHAFAENQALEVANIPLGIDKLGNGAFANCLKLKVVSLPASVREIGANCFFNCVELQRINFAGTKEQWRSVRRGSNWLAKAKTTEVVCNDGAVVVNPFH